MDNYEDTTLDAEWQHLLALKNDPTRWFELGRELLRIANASRRSGSFASIVANLGYQPRTAYSLTEIAKKLDRIGVEPPAEIGWRKLADLITVINEDNYLEVFELCKEHTRTEIARYLWEQIQERMD